MALKTLKKQQEVLLKILSCSLDGTKYILKNDEDSSTLFEESRLQSVSLQALNSIENVSDDKWERYSTAIYLNNIEVHSHHAYLHKLMSENGIEYCVLKGCAAAFYYPDATLRTMGDVDFLVRPEDVEKAREVFLKEGFYEKQQNHICHLVFKKGKMHFEMHFEPAGMPDGDKRVLVEKQLQDIFEKAQDCTINSVCFKKPSHFHHALVILMHMYHHLTSEGIGLRHLCDWAAFIGNVEQKEIIAEIKPRLSEIGLWNFACILSQICCLYLGIKHEEWMGDIDEQLCLDIITDIFAGGNFGAKDERRSMQGNAISNRGKDGYNRSSFIQFFVSINALAQTQFPILKRSKILRPFGWIALGARRTFRVIKGTRKMPKIKGTFSAANKRKEIYKKFHLFETEF